ncbi:MAG: DUF4351 domain-containing protein [Burkholderiaceae bacterium]|nr:DUF4351 domain-containing protein [Burkholderiaceae bacterium]
MPDSVTDYDSPWKVAIRQYFPAFVALLAPWLHGQIDWSVPPAFLDKELQAINHASATGRRYADMLVQVYTHGQQPIWLLIHIEVQSGRVTVKNLQVFSERMFSYYCRIRSHYPASVNGHTVQITSLGVLTAGTSQATQLTYSEGNAASGAAYLNFAFPIVNLATWRARWEELEQLAATNPFAVVVMAQLQAQQTRKNDPVRVASKTQLMRLLYRYHYRPEDVYQLFRLINWIINISADLQPAFEDAMIDLEQEYKVSYVTSIERSWLKRGRALGLEEGLQKGLMRGLRQGEAKGIEQGVRKGEATLLERQLVRKFGPLPKTFQQRLQSATPAQLETWSLNVLDADSLAEVFTH